VRLRSGGLQFEVNPDKQFVSKITRAKWTGGMAQAIELLLFKDLSSNPSHIKKKKVYKHPCKSEGSPYISWNIIQS
jgi:hypothetical protein